MDFIKFMLSDEKIVSKYKDIDKTNMMPANHGMKHILNVIKIAEQIGALFDFSERDFLILKTALVLHDIGQVGGVRKDHWVKSSEFAREYLPSKNIFSTDELEMIYSAILTHDEFLDYSKFENKYSWFVALIDKLDFDKTRLEDDYLTRFDYCNSQDIERLEFKLKDNEFVIVIKIIENPKMIAPENIYNRNLICKAMTLLVEFSKHFNIIARVFLENEELDFAKFNKDKMINR